MFNLRAAKWGYATRSGDRLPFVWIDDEVAAVFFPSLPTRGGVAVEIWFLKELVEYERVEVGPFGEPFEAHVAEALTGVSAEDLHRLESFCAEPRTMQEIAGLFESEQEEKEIDPYNLRQLGVLKDSGRKGREIACLWGGYNVDTLLDVARTAIKEELDGVRKKGSRVPEFS
jgi:hypothetical protein